MPMKTYVVIYCANGDVIATPINGCEQEIKDYYQVGKEFNVGRMYDVMTTIDRVEIIN